MKKLDIYKDLIQNICEYTDERFAKDKSKTYNEHRIDLVRELSALRKELFPKDNKNAQWSIK